jgi:hypothetical protein
MYLSLFSLGLVHRPNRPYLFRESFWLLETRAENVNCVIFKTCLVKLRKLGRRKPTLADKTHRHYGYTGLTDIDAILAEPIQSSLFDKRTFHNTLDPD